MKAKDLANYIAENHEIMCYVADLENYDILFINDKAKQTLGNLKKITKCYNIFNNADEPCTNCNNSMLVDNETTYKVMQNKNDGKFYSFMESLITVDGRPARLTYIMDIAVQEKYFNITSPMIHFEQTLTKCIKTLIEDVDIDEAIDNLLSTIGDYYRSDRAYIFEIDNNNNLACNSYEWSMTSDLVTIDKFATIPLDDLKPFIDLFAREGEVYIRDIDDSLEKASVLHNWLKDTNTTSMLLVPVYERGQLTTFIGVDNQKQYVDNPELLHAISFIIADNIKKRKLFKELEKLSYYDTLTGLYNRNKYTQFINELKLNDLTSIGFFHINVNELKVANEVYGEAYGDSLIKQVATILKENIKHNIFRLSGDEFIAICPDISRKEFERLIDKLRMDDRKESEYSFAVGGAWQDKKFNIQLGLSHAAEIMYAEKQNYYKAKDANTIKSRLNPVEIILNEIASDCFKVYLQPKVNLATGKISSAEALIRKFSKSGKMISPDNFIPIYERESTIRHLDFFVLEKVCILLQLLIKEGKQLKIAVNFSRITFVSYDLVDEVIKTCAKYGVPHEYIVIEVTESIDKMDMDFLNKKLDAIKNAGFPVSLDDFGAKHSNLLMLTSEVFSEVKIDKGLVDNITKSAQNRTVVRNIIKTIKELDISDCMAEGIETKEQKDILHDLGCTYGQGYYFYRPMPIDDFLEVYYNDKGITETMAPAIIEAPEDGFMLSSDEMYAILEAMPLCMNLWNHKRENVACNIHAATLFDLESKEEYLQKFFMLSPEKQPDGRYSQIAAMTYINEARNNGYAKFYWKHCKINGEEIPAEITLVRLDVKSEDGDYFIAGFTRDLRNFVSSTNTIEKFDGDLHESVSDKILLDTLIGFINEIIFVYDLRENHINYFGKSIENYSDAGLSSIFNISDSRHLYEEDKNNVLEALKNVRKGIIKPFEVRLISDNGITRYNRIEYDLIKDNRGLPLFVVGKATDIHDQKMFEQQARLDLLVNCYNKITAENEIAKTLSESNHDSKHAMFIIDIDDFKLINDNLGHQFGDLVLQEVGTNIKACFRSHDIVGRLGGDEFIVLLKNISDINLVTQKAEKLIDIFKNMLFGENNMYKISGSVGIAMFPYDGENFIELYKATDKALYRSKTQGKDCYTIYSAEFNEGTMKNLTLLDSAHRSANTYFDVDLISSTFNMLYETKNLDITINIVLQNLGKRFDVDRSYVFETHDDGISYNNTYEWCKPGITPEINNLKNVTAEELSDFFNCATDDGVFFSNDLSILKAEGAYELMANQGILSFLHAQTRKDNYVSMFLGFDDCTTHRVWSEKEVNTIKYISKLLSTFLLIRSQELDSVL